MKTITEDATAATTRKLDGTIQRTPHPDCPACQAKRMHRTEEWDAFHPDAGSGILDGRPMLKVKP